MEIKKLPPGKIIWHLGEKYDIAIGECHVLNATGDRTKIDVFIRDRKGNIQYRVGDGRQMGNFHPIWVSFRGKRITVEELLRMT